MIAAGNPELALRAQYQLAISIPFQLMPSPRNSAKLLRFLTKKRCRRSPPLNRRFFSSIRGASWRANVADVFGRHSPDRGEDSSRVCPGGRYNKPDHEHFRHALPYGPKVHPAVLPLQIDDSPKLALISHGRQLVLRHPGPMAAKNPEKQLLCQTGPSDSGRFPRHDSPPGFGLESRKLVRELGRLSAKGDRAACCRVKRS